MKVVVILLIIVSAFWANAEIINVPDDIETIQGAIDASDDGDTVLVAPGEYVENIDFAGKAILLIGNPDDPSEVVIDGNEDGTVVTFSNGEVETSIINGFTITNGLAESYGGGIFCDATSPTIRKCHVTQNEGRGNYGGGIFLRESESLIEYCEITYNNMRIAGAGIGFQVSSPILRGCLIANNNAGGSASGIYCYNQCFPQLINCTIINNVSEGNRNLIYVSGHSQMTISNSVIVDNSPNLITVSETATLDISFTNLQGGEDNIDINYDWGEGNINENPLFVDINEGDYHLTEESPCVDTGDPETEVDLDGTRADMGCYPFMQIGAVLEGHVVDADNNEPITNVLLANEYGQSVMVDSIGFWRLHILPSREHTITAYGSGGYQDSTVVIDAIDFHDTLEVNFNLLHAELNSSQDDFIEELGVGDSTSINFNVRNDGNGVLQWSVSPSMRGAMAPWQLRETIMVGDIVDDARVRAVVLVEDRYYIAAGGSSARDDNFIYVLNRDGELLRSHPQLGQARYGMGDLAWDGELIWGCSEELIYGFNINGDSVTSFEGPYGDNQAITWDSDRELLWITGKIADYIFGYNREGIVIDSISQFDFMIFGLAYFPDDADGYPLYVTHYISVPNDADYQVLHKINLNERDTIFVAQQYFEIGDPQGKPEGIFITDQFEPFSWVMLSIANNTNHDRLDIWQVEGKSSWMRIEPVAGIINPDEQEEFTLTLDATDLEPMVYPGELQFRHSGLGGETIIPIDLTVSPSVVGGDAGTKLPTEFSITGVYPNPFNSSAIINYALPQSQRVSVQLYDLSGRLVETLYDDLQTVGNHSVTWNSGNFGSGIYLLRIQTDKEVKVAKLVAVK